MQCIFLALILIMQTALSACVKNGKSETTEAQTTEAQTTAAQQTELASVPETTTEQTEAATEQFVEYIVQAEAATQEETTDEPSNPAMQRLMGEFGDIVQICGFEYDAENDLFYSTMYPV